jgi:branched-chain amino acid transport system ATP-binding protein
VQALGRIIMKLKERGFTIVLVEQNFRFAAPLADRFYIMEHGKIAETFAAPELESKTQLLREYLGV